MYGVAYEMLLPMCERDLKKKNLTFAFLCFVLLFSLDGLFTKVLKLWIILSSSSFARINLYFKPTPLLWLRKACLTEINKVRFMSEQCQYNIRTMSERLGEDKVHVTQQGLNSVVCKPFSCCCLLASRTTSLVS